jgi:hypothetical protein
MQHAIIFILKDLKLRGNNCIGFSYQEQAQIWHIWKDDESFSDSNQISLKVASFAITSKRIGLGNGGRFNCQKH